MSPCSGCLSQAPSSRGAPYVLGEWGGGKGNLSPPRVRAAGHCPLCVPRETLVSGQYRPLLGSQPAGEPLNDLSLPAESHMHWSQAGGSSATSHCVDGPGRARASHPASKCLKWELCQLAVAGGAAWGLCPPASSCPTPEALEGSPASHPSLSAGPLLGPPREGRALPSTSHYSGRISPGRT